MVEQPGRARRFGRSAEQGAGIQADGVLQCRFMRPRPDSHAVGTVHKGDRPLTTIDQWPRRDKHWKDGRSAKENARAWIDASLGLQPDIAQILAACRGMGLCASGAPSPKPASR